MKRRPAKQRKTSDITNTSFSLRKSLLVAIDDRAEALGLSRSQYLCRLIKSDLQMRGTILIEESRPNSYDPTPPSYLPIRKPRTDTAEQFGAIHPPLYVDNRTPLEIRASRNDMPAERNDGNGGADPDNTVPSMGNDGARRTKPNRERPNAARKRGRATDL